MRSRSSGICDVVPSHNISFHCRCAHAISINLSFTPWIQATSGQHTTAHSTRTENQSLSLSIPLHLIFRQISASCCGRKWVSVIMAAGNRTWWHNHDKRVKITFRTAQREPTSSDEIKLRFSNGIIINWTRFSVEDQRTFNSKQQENTYFLSSSLATCCVIMSLLPLLVGLFSVKWPKWPKWLNGENVLMPPLNKNLRNHAQ